MVYARGWVAINRRGPTVETLAERNPYAWASVAVVRSREYIPRTMATNGANGKKGPAKGSKKAAPKATAAQQRARREYLKLTGHTFDPKRIDKIRALWAD